MTDTPVPVERIDLGVTDGLHTVAVRRVDTGEVIGYDLRIAEEPTPADLVAEAEAWKAAAEQ